MSDWSGRGGAAWPGRGSGVRRAEARRARRLLLLAVLTSLTLLLIDVRGSSGGATLDPARRAVAAAVLPAMDAARRLGEPVRERAAQIRDAAGGAAERDARIADLEAQVAALTAAQVTGTDAARQAADRQRLLAGAARVPGVRAIPARVLVLADGGPSGWTASLDVGTADGVEPDLAVVASGGLVGRVLRADPHSATVLLLADPTLAVGVRSAAEGRIALARGAGRPGALTLTALADAAIPAGRAVVTAGSPGGRPFPPGIPVGVVAADPDHANGPLIVVPAVDVGRADTVAVLAIGSASASAASPSAAPLPTRAPVVPTPSATPGGFATVPGSAR